MWCPIQQTQVNNPKRNNPLFHSISICICVKTNPLKFNAHMYLSRTHIKITGLESIFCDKIKRKVK